MSKTSHIDLVTETFSVKCVPSESSLDKASSFVITPGDLQYISNDGIRSIEVNSTASAVNGPKENWLRGQWNFDKAPKTPNSILAGQVPNLAQVQKIVEDGVDALTLQGVYDNNTEPVNGFEGSTPTEFRVGNSAIKLSDGNITVGIREVINNRVLSQVDWTGDSITFTGKILVPDAISNVASKQTAVNIATLEHRLANILNGTNVWTKLNTFTGGIKSTADPVEDDDAANKKYVDGVASGSAGEIAKLRQDLDSFETQDHTWEAQNVFVGNTRTTKAPVFDQDVTNKVYVDAQIGGSVEAERDRAMEAEAIIASDLSDVKNNLDSFETQDHSWSGANTFIGTLKFTGTPTGVSDVTNVDYVDKKVETDVGTEKNRALAAEALLAPKLNPAFTGKLDLMSGVDTVFHVDPTLFSIETDDLLVGSSARFTKDVAFNVTPTVNTKGALALQSEVTAETNRAVSEETRINDELDSLRADVDGFEDQTHYWAGDNSFERNIVNDIAPSADSHLTNKGYVDKQVAKATSWKGGLDVTGATTTLPILENVYPGFSWRISAGTITVAGVKYGNGDLIIADVEMLGTAPKPVSSFSFFNGQDADVVLLAEKQALTNKDLTSNSNVYRKASAAVIGAVMVDEAGAVDGSYGNIRIDQASKVHAAPATPDGTKAGVVKLGAVTSTVANVVPTSAEVKAYAEGGFLPRGGEVTLTGALNIKALNGTELLKLDPAGTGTISSFGNWLCNSNATFTKPVTFTANITSTAIPIIKDKGALALLSDVTTEVTRAKAEEKRIDGRFVNYALKNGDSTEDFNAKDIRGSVIYASRIYANIDGTVGVYNGQWGLSLDYEGDGQSPGRPHIFSYGYGAFDFTDTATASPEGVIRRAELKTYLPLAGGKLTGTLHFGTGWQLQNTAATNTISSVLVGGDTQLNLSGTGAEINLLNGAEIHRGYGTYGDLATYEDTVVPASLAIKNEFVKTNKAVADNKSDALSRTTTAQQTVAGRVDFTVGIRTLTIYSDFGTRLFQVIQGYGYNYENVYKMFPYRSSVPFFESLVPGGSDTRLNVKLIKEDGVSLVDKYALKSDVDGFEGQAHTWTGVNTFSKIVSCSVAPTTANHLVNKAFLDSRTNGMVTTAASQALTNKTLTDASNKFRLATATVDGTFRVTNSLASIPDPAAVVPTVGAMQSYAAQKNGEVGNNFSANLLSAISVETESVKTDTVDAQEMSSTDIKVPERFTKVAPNLIVLSNHVDWNGNSSIKSQTTSDVDCALTIDVYGQTGTSIHEQYMFHANLSNRNSNISYLSNSVMRFSDLADLRVGEAGNVDPATDTTELVKMTASVHATYAGSAPTLVKKNIMKVLQLPVAGKPTTRLIFGGTEPEMQSNIEIIFDCPTEFHQTVKRMTVDSLSANTVGGGSSGVKIDSHIIHLGRDGGQANISVSDINKTVQLSGTVSAPTPATADSSTKVATTAYVKANITPINTSISTLTQKIAALETKIKALEEAQAKMSAVGSQVMTSGLSPEQMGLPGTWGLVNVI